MSQGLVRTVRDQLETDFGYGKLNLNCIELLVDDDKDLIYETRSGLVVGHKICTYDIWRNKRHDATQT